MQTNAMTANQKIIPMGGLQVSQGDAVLRTFVGSCVAICLFDNVKEIGGIAHVMLPRNNTGKTTIGTNQEGKFADEAIECLVNKLKNISAEVNLQAKIVGGAKIFSHETDEGVLNIGKRNVMAIEEILHERKIPIVAKTVGLNHGRWVSLFCDTHRVIVKEKGCEKIL